MKIILYFFFGLLLISCRDINKPNADAIKIYNEAQSHYNPPFALNIDSAILLLDSAISIEPTYINPYILKTSCYITNREFNKALEVNSIIQKMRPEQPLWVIQEGLLYELNKNIPESHKAYNKGIEMYEQIINAKLDTTLNFKLEYISYLIIADKKEQAISKIKELQKTYPTNQFLDIKNFIHLKENILGTIVPLHDTIQSLSKDSTITNLKSY